MKELTLLSCVENTSGVRKNIIVRKALATFYDVKSRYRDNERNSTKHCSPTKEISAADIDQSPAYRSVSWR